MSSLNEISMDQLGNRVVVRGWGVTPPAPPLSTSAFRQIFKDDVKGFSSSSDICFRVVGQPWSEKIKPKKRETGHCKQY